MAVQFDSTIDWDAWYFVAIRWIVDQWVYFVVALIASMAVVILLKVLSPWLHEIYKSILGYEDLLIDMKRALEDDYEDHWDDPDFCVAFLKMSIAVGVTSAAAILGIVASLFTVGIILNDINGLRSDITNGMDQFRVITDETWLQIMEVHKNPLGGKKAPVSFNTLVGRKKRQSDQCNCGPRSEGCPAGPPGPAGDKGLPGLAGEDGKDGENGKDGLDILAEKLVPEGCIKCPAGPPGPPGPPGEHGPDGAQGHPGRRGPPGNPGLKGEKGPVGDEGEQGPPGREGPKGPVGEPGTQYHDGPVGHPGPPGERGSPGEPGKEGTPGEDGEPGRPGYPGRPGQPGKRGSDGHPGAPGKDASAGPDAGYCPCPPRNN